MALTPDQLTPMLLAKLRDALERRIGDTNRTGAMQRAADDLGIVLSTFKTRLYGETLPDMAEWEAMQLLWPGIRQEVVGAIDGQVTSPHPEAVEIADTLEQAAAKLRRQA